MFAGTRRSVNASFLCKVSCALGPSPCEVLTFETRSNLDAHLLFIFSFNFRLFSDKDRLTGLTHRRNRTLRSHYGYCSNFSKSRTWTLFTVCKDFLYGIAFEQCVESSGSDRKKNLELTLNLQLLQFDLRTNHMEGDREEDLQRKTKISDKEKLCTWREVDVDLDTIWAKLFKAGLR